jgi:hypothetical protein
VVVDVEIKGFGEHFNLVDDSEWVPRSEHHLAVQARPFNSRTLHRPH